MKGLLEKAAAPQEAQDSEGVSDLGDEALEKAVAYVGQRLYTEEMSNQIAATFDDSPAANAEAISVIAYKLAQKADEATGGEILEENLSVLGMLTLNEILTVAEAAGMPITGETAAKAMKRMVVMFATDNGIPMEELQAQFAQVDDGGLAQAAEEAPDDLDQYIADDDSPVGENIEASLGDSQQPQQGA